MIEQSFQDAITQAITEENCIIFDEEQDYYPGSKGVSINKIRQKLNFPDGEFVNLPEQRMQYRTAYQSALRFNNVLKNTEYPYCCIGLLVGTRAIGTAFLIGTNLLLTCAHNILHKTVEKKSDQVDDIQEQIWFCPGLSKKGLTINPKVRFAVENKKGLSQKWKQFQGYLKLCPFKTIDSYWDIFGLFQREIKSKSFKIKKLAKKITNCWLSKNGQERNIKPIDEVCQILSILSYQWLANNFSCQIGGSQFKKEHGLKNYPLQACGMSGSPIFYQDNGDYVVIGIQNYSSRIQNIKQYTVELRGRLLSTDVIKNFNQIYKNTMPTYKLRLKKQNFKRIQQNFVKDLFGYHEKKYITNLQIWTGDSHHFVEGIKRIQFKIQSVSTFQMDLNLQSSDLQIIFSKQLSFRWKSLKELNLNWNKIDDSGANLISKLFSDQLEILELELNQITDTGLQELNLRKWNMLRYLNLRCNLITFDNFSGFAQGSWGNLEILYISAMKGGPSNYNRMIEVFKPSALFLEALEIHDLPYFKQRLGLSWQQQYLTPQFNSMIVIFGELVTKIFFLE